LSRRALTRLAVLWGALLVATPALAEQPAEVLVGQGILRYQAGDLEGAADLLRRALAQQPELVAAGHYLGLAQIRQGQTGQGRRTLSRMARLDPKNPRLLLDLGLAYLAEGNMAWAVRTLRAAQKLDRRNARIHYYLGVATLRMGAPAKAIPHLEAARFEPAVDQQALRLNLSLAYYRAGEGERSRALLRGARGWVADGLMRATYEAEDTAASWISATLVASGVVDSNPLYRAETTGPSGVGPALSGSLTLRPYVGSRWLMWGEAAASRTFYFPGWGEGDDVVEDASTTDLGGAAFVAARFPREGRALQLSLGYSFHITLFDGEWPLADENHVFLEQHSGHLALLHKTHDGGISWQLRYGLVRQDYADLPRSNWGNELAVEHSRNVLGRGRLLSWLSVRYELAHVADYDALVPGCGAGLSYLAPWDLVPGVRLGYEHENHVRSEDGRWTDRRMDNTLNLSVEVSRALAWGLRLRAVYQWLRNFSNVPDFDYDRHLASLELSWSI
jgi:Flp pilus assembly protein TadD